MQVKACSCCKMSKQLSDFHYKKSEGRFNSWCKACLYLFQKDRWISRKIDAVKLMGGRCCHCGYDRNLSALVFHHIDPNQKEMSWTELRLRPWERVIQELEQCILLCFNCHSEIHYPHYNKSYMSEKMKSNNFLNKEFSGGYGLGILQSSGKCIICDKNVYSTKYCSVKCAQIGSRKVKERPDKESLEKEIANNSWIFIGKKYGVSDVAVRKWAKQYGLI